ncbi:phosphatase PAP2 family protein [Acidovorax sp. NCPPB 4044]|uniref:phosphatase PAP2 family protein n=1 Tax=Acidovorax sp. NCPPB 4044 TaxID=2940490 RepID=UPI0023042CDD|nr:phosphatase PAP2 family protein [Acidovorax sp. NCPPB 4044]MDA8523590.1 phosphatase PAP2 family protein [Acidovorax sp. NCPPB 4044]
MTAPTAPPSAPRAPSAPPHPLAPLFWTTLALGLLIAWDTTAFDLALARVFGNGGGFPLRDDWFFASVMHEGARRAAWVLMVLLAASVWWPVGWLRRLSTAERAQMAASALIALGVVTAFKQASATSCPWDLAEFGGMARYVSHWSRGIFDGGSGHCFPAGHASAGFAFLGGYFALRHRHPGPARWWLAASIAAGLILGAAQQVRGAHFMSHTLWTGWLCWTAGWACDLAAGLLCLRHAPSDSVLPSEGASHART